MSDARIYLILPYFGKLPNYFQLYLDSLSINKDVLSVLLVSDISTEGYQLPENLIIEKMSLESVKERASAFLKREYDVTMVPADLIKAPYKLCDYRPIYPLLFEDILEKNNVRAKDYVGHGDCDLIYGKLSRIIDFSKNYHVIGSWGHFCVYKYKLIDVFHRYMADLAGSLIHENYIGIDEWLNTTGSLQVVIDSLVKKNRISQFTFTDSFCDINPPRFNPKLTMTTFPKLPIEYLIFDRQIERLRVYFENKTVFNVSYVHLQKRPMKYDFTTYENMFYILEDRFDTTLLKA